MNIDKTIFGFTAITKYADEIKKIMPNCIIERPTIEDIMLCNVKGREVKMLFQLVKRTF